MKGLENNSKLLFKGLVLMMTDLTVGNWVLALFLFFQTFNLKIFLFSNLLFVILYSFQLFY